MERNPRKMAVLVVSDTADSEGDVHGTAEVAYDQLS